MCSWQLQKIKIKLQHEFLYMHRAFLMLFRSAYTFMCTFELRIFSDSYSGTRGRYKANMHNQIHNKWFMLNEYRKSGAKNGKQ